MHFTAMGLKRNLADIPVICLASSSLYIKAPKTLEVRLKYFEKMKHSENQILAQPQPLSF